MREPPWRSSKHADWYNRDVFPYHDENETQRPAVVTIGRHRVVRARLDLHAGRRLERAARATSVCNLGLIPGELTGMLRAGVGFELGDGLVLSSPIRDHSLRTSSPRCSCTAAGCTCIGNMWFLWLFGNNIEDSMTRPRFIAFYLLCGVAAALAQVLAEPSIGHPDGRRLGRHQRRHGRISRALSARPRLHARAARILRHDHRTAGLGHADLLDGPAGRQRPRRSLAADAGGGGVAFWAHSAASSPASCWSSSSPRSNHILAHENHSLSP